MKKAASATPMPPNIRSPMWRSLGERGRARRRRARLR
jgi:hypothetical protein